MVCALCHIGRTTFFVVKEFVKCPKRTCQFTVTLICFDFGLSVTHLACISEGLKLVPTTKKFWARITPRYARAWRNSNEYWRNIFGFLIQSYLQPWLYICSWNIAARYRTKLYNYENKVTPCGWYWWWATTARHLDWHSKACACVVYLRISIFRFCRPVRIGCLVNVFKISV